MKFSSEWMAGRLAAPLPMIGISMQKRNYFWYRKTFAAPKKREVALLKINKSQFGTKVWLNGKEVGEHLGSWPADSVQCVNRPQTAEEEQAIASCIARGRPFGTPDRVAAAVAKLGLQVTLRPRGRSRKSPEKVPDPPFIPLTPFYHL